MPDRDALPRAVLDSDALPLYVRLATRLAEDVGAAGGREGDRLPSERTLAERYAVSRVTVRAALGELRRIGRADSSPARGWYLTAGDAADGPGPAPDRAAGPPAHTVRGFADLAASRGLTVRSDVLHHRVRPADVDEAEALHLAPGADLVDLRRLRFLDGLVVVLEHNRLPLAACPALARTDFTVASLYATLRTADPPRYPRMADYTVEARKPSAAERDLLGAGADLPMLVARQLSYDQHGDPLELTVHVYRGDRYRFSGSITD